MQVQWQFEVWGLVASHFDQQSVGVAPKEMTHAVQHALQAGHTHRIIASSSPSVCLHVATLFAYCFSLALGGAHRGRVIDACVFVGMGAEYGVHVMGSVAACALKRKSTETQTG